MNECKFCYVLENGDIPNDREDIAFLENIEIKYPIISGRLECKNYINMAATIAPGEEGQFLYMTGWDDEGVDIFSKRIPIKYCPMCGRKLNEEDK